MEYYSAVKKSEIGFVAAAASGVEQIICERKACGKMRKQAWFGHHPRCMEICWKEQYRRWGKKAEPKKFGLKKKARLCPHRKESSPLGELVGLYSSQIPNFARATERAFVPHVEKE